MKYTRTAVLLVSALVVVGGIVALVPGGGASASATGSTQLEQSSINASAPALPTAVVVSAAGSYDYDNLDSPASHMIVRIAADTAGDRDTKTIASLRRNLSGTSGSGVFANVSGDVTDTKAASGWNQEEFFKEGGTQTNEIDIRITGELVTEDGTTHVLFATTRTVVTRFDHTTPNPDPEATVNGTVGTLSGYYRLTNGERAGQEQFPVDCDDYTPDYSPPMHCA